MTHKQKILVEERAKGKSIKEAAEIAGYNYAYARQLLSNMTNPAFNCIKAPLAKRKAEINAKIEEETEINAVELVRKFKAIHDRCMQEVPVLDHEGNKTGEFRFEPNPACKALENIGRIKGLYEKDNEQQGKTIVDILAIVGTKRTPEAVSGPAMSILEAERVQGQGKTKTGE